MTVTVSQAHQCVRDLLLAAGLSGDKAGETARAVVLADVWGVGSHGLLRLPYYLERMLAGGYPPDAELRTICDTGPMVSMDGGGGLGHWQVQRAAHLSIERCRTYGLAAVGVGNSGHCGALGVYTLPALGAGLVTLVFSHGPAVMPAWGAAQALLSTSPVAAGFPSRPRPVIVDLATSAVARGKIASYAGRGEPLPEGWALDASGEPTTDPELALLGLLSPLGGAKGYALALMVEAMTAGLVGPTLSADVPDMFKSEDTGRPQQIAHLVITLDPARFGLGGAQPAQERMDDLARRIVDSGGRLPGARRALPDEIDDAMPLTVDEKIWDQLQEWKKRLDSSRAHAHPDESARTNGHGRPSTIDHTTAI